jgi:outer membrane lipoprotein-sorting protein
MLKIVSKLFFVSIIIFLSSCTVKHAGMPAFEGTDVREALSSRANIASIETTFSIAFEKEDTEIRGTGMLNIAKNGDLSMRVYSFGFLAFEMTSENGIIKSAPAIDKNKGIILTYGLRDCLFWWDLKDFEINEKEDHFVLRNHEREVWLDKKTAFPKKQIIFLGDGKELNIYYDDPEKAGNFWYPAKVRIELSRYAVTLKVKDISFAHEG